MVVEHLVFFKFQTLTSEQEIAISDAINSLKSLKYVKESSFGKNYNEARCAGYTHALRSLFASKQDLEDYFPCDEHQKVLNFIKPFFASEPMCLDFEI
jgi:hypothetical protein